jgi:hypothetical protein
MPRLRKTFGFALVAISVMALIPPALIIFPSLDQWHTLGLSQGAWRTLILLAWISGAGLVGGIWIIKTSY